MSVSPAANIIARPRPVRPVPKPVPPLNQHHQRALAAAEGYLFDDLAADADAIDRLQTAKRVDRRRDGLIRSMLRLFVAIRSDRSTGRVSRALAEQGRALGTEAIRLDAIVDEHDEHAAHDVAASIAAGRAVMAVHEAILTGPAEICGKRHPLTDDLARLGVTIQPCSLGPHAEGPCVFLADGAGPDRPIDRMDGGGM